jgi:hypothetical protein
MFIYCAQILDIGRNLPHQTGNLALVAAWTTTAEEGTTQPRIEDL